MSYFDILNSKLVCDSKIVVGREGRFSLTFVFFGGTLASSPVVASPLGTGAPWDTGAVVAALEGLCVCGTGGTPARKKQRANVSLTRPAQ